MRDPVHSVEIDRIILTDLELTPDRAERVRPLVEAELQRLLERHGPTHGLTGGEVRRLQAPTLHLAEPPSDNRLATGLAQSIAQALRGAD